ncbi:hypothetical protein CR513_20707, partial [Mucuna pruriens]
MVNPNQNDWSRLLEETLWAHRSAYRTLLGMYPYQIVFGKACHLPVEIEHRACWAIKKFNMAYDQAGQERKLLKFIVGKLRSRWNESFVVTNVFPYGVVELRDEANNRNFKFSDKIESRQSRPSQKKSLQVDSDPIG